MKGKLPTEPTDWTSLRSGLLEVGRGLGKNPDTLAKALDRGGALVDVVAALFGVERPRLKPGPKLSAARDDLLVGMNDHLRQQGLRGEELKQALHREVDTNDSLMGLLRLNNPGGTLRAAQKAAKRRKAKR